MISSAPSTAPGSPASALPPARLDSARIRFLRQLEAGVFRKDEEYTQCSRSFEPSDDGQLVDYLFATATDPRTPDQVFHRLRWGGQYIYASRDANAVAEVEKKFNNRGGFTLHHSGQSYRTRFLGLHWPWITKTIYYVAARKTSLIRPGESTDRFTYHVEIIQNAKFGPDPVVMKQVPTFDRVVSRLREKFPDTPLEEIKRRARKFTDKIFPVFLTREAAILRILGEHLPAQYLHRVPTLLGVEKDSNGYVKTLYMNWLRNAPPGQHPLSQLEFAKQSADLLRAIHDVVGVIHLDLRLDNVVITRHGVGFVDFGSAVRVGENLKESSLLSNLFEEMMRTSQIQRMLGKMQDKGLVTSTEITNSYHKVDKAIDFFYLAVQINAPHSNPDFKGLIEFHPDSAEARQLSALTADILRPKDADKCAFKSAKDILAGILEIERHLKLPRSDKTPRPTPASEPVPVGMP